MKTLHQSKVQTKAALTPTKSRRIAAPAHKTTQRRAKRAAVVAKPVVAVAPPQPVNKKRLIETMLRRADGCTVAELIAATGWQKHSLRAAMTGFCKAGCTIDHDKIDGDSRYRLVEVS